MSDFKSTLKKIIDEKGQNTPIFRKKIYQKARINLLAILEKIDSSIDVKEQKIQNLEQDILNLENEYITQQKASILKLNKNIQLSTFKPEFHVNNLYKKHRDNELPEHNEQKIIKIFDEVKEQELRNKNKKKIITLILSIIFMLIFIFSFIGIAWKFFSHHTRNIVKHEIINTKLDSGITTEKFDDRLINTDSNKHNAPIRIKTAPAITYDTASYIDADQKMKPANISWSKIQSTNKDNILSANINVIDSNTKLNFVLQKNYNKNYKGNSIIDITYNDENYAITDLLAEKTTLILIKNGNELTLNNSNFYYPTTHNLIFSFDDTDYNIQNLKKAEAIKINFTYKNNKNITIKFSKDKNGKIFFDNFN